MVHMMKTMICAITTMNTIQYVEKKNENVNTLMYDMMVINQINVQHSSIPIIEGGNISHLI